MAKTVIYSANAPDPIGPYSQAIRNGGICFVSGQIALLRTTGKLLEGTLTEETDQVMRNIAEILNAADMDFSHVVKCTIFLRDMEGFPDVNKAYGLHFPKDPPARETVEVSRLPKDANVEISCIAIK